MGRKELLKDQRWSESNPEIIIEWGVGGRKPDPNDPSWTVSIDTPKYVYYSKYRNLTKGGVRHTLEELEDFIAENLTYES